MKQVKKTSINCDEVSRGSRSERGVYQQPLDIAARADATEGIRQGLEQAKRGDSRDIDDFFADFEASHGISG